MTVPKPLKPSFESELTHVLNHGALSATDRAHLARWLAEAEDPLWEQIARDATANHHEAPDSYRMIIVGALKVRERAETMEAPHLQRREAQDREQQERAKLLTLANDIDQVVRRHREAQNFELYRKGKTGLSPDGPSNVDMGIQESLAWLAKEAERLREFAVLKAADHYLLLADWGAHVSRTRARKNRIRSRELNVFIELMIKLMKNGKPNYNAVAVMTNIAFTDADVDAEDVRAAWKQTTRKRQVSKAARCI
jgi:hypothetical protein